MNDERKSIVLIVYVEPFLCKMEIFISPFFIYFILREVDGYNFYDAYTLMNV